MGLPAKFQHPEHGLCLTLYAALAHLKALNIPCTHQGEEIILYAGQDHERRVTPITLPIGKMYPVIMLES